MESTNSLFDHYADIPALQAEKQEVLNIFAEIRAGIKALGEAGFKVDTAKTVTQMQTAVKDINKLQDQLIAKTRELEIYELRLENLRQKNIEAQLRIEKIQNDIAVKQAQQLKEQAKAEEVKNRLLQQQETELDKVIAKEKERQELVTSNQEKRNIPDRGLTVQGQGQFPAAPLVRFNPEDELKGLHEGIEAVNEMDRAEADLIMTTKEWAATQGEVNTKVQGTQKGAKETVVAVNEAKGAYDEFTGSINDNLRAQVENTVALQKIKNEQKAINKEIKDQGGVANENQLAQLTELKNKEVALTQANKELNTTLKNQVIALKDNEGAAAQLRAELNLLKQTYESMTAAERGTDFGKLTKKNIDILAPQVSSLEKEMLKGRHGLDTLEGGLEKAGKRLVGFVTRDLFRAIAGFFVFTLAFEAINFGIEKFIEWVNKMSDAEALAAAKLKDLNDVMAAMNKDAGKELNDLKLLRDAAQDVTLPMETRLKAIRGLKQEFPEYYKQINDEVILLGEDKKAYDAATDSILKHARAKAAKSKIDELESQRLDAQYDKQKIFNAATNEAGRAKTTTETVATIIPGTGEQKLVEITTTKEEKLAIIVKRTTEAYKEKDKVLRDIEAREKFLLQFVDKKALVDEIVKPAPKTALGPTDENYYRLLKMEEHSAEEYRKFLQKESIEEQLLIEQNEALTLKVRLEARQKRLNIEKSILAEETESKLKEIDYAAAKERSKRKISQREIDLIDQDAQNKRNLVQEDALKKLTLLEGEAAIDVIKIKKRAHDKEIEDYKAFIEELERQEREAIERRKAFLEKNYKETNLFQQTDANKASGEKIEKAVSIIKGLDGSKDGDKIKQIYKQLQYELVVIEQDRQAKSLQNEIDFWRQIVDTTKEGSTEQIEAKKNLSDVQRQLDELIMKRQKDAVDTLIDAHDKLMNSYKRLGKEAGLAAKAFLESIYDKQIDKIERQIDLVDELKAAEIKRIEETSASEQDKAAKISILEAKAQADKEALARRQKQIEREKAKFDKVYKSFEITAEGIKSVNAIKLQIAEITAKANANPLNPIYRAAIPLTASQLPIAIATTAAELAAVLAQPLPGYWTGTMSSKHGKAWVAEKGPELTKDPFGNWKYYETPTIANLIGGTRVFNAGETKTILKTTDKERMKLVYALSSPVKQDKDERELQELKKLNKKEFKASVNIYNSTGVETTSWYQNQFKL